MKVLHILNSFSLGGAENIAISIINELKSDCEFGYCCLKGGNIGEFLQKMNVRYFACKKINVRNIKKIINDFKPDIIHAHDFTASVIAALSTKIPIVSHIHHNSFFIRTRNLKTIAYNFFRKKYKKIIFVSESARDEYFYHNKIESKTIVLHNMIDAEKIKHLAKEFVTKKYDVIFVGRIEEEKNPLRFLNIIRQVTKDVEFSNIKVAMVGQGLLLDECKEYVKRHKIKNVDFLGFQNNPYPFLKNSKILCITSKYEGYGLVAEEAKVLNIPVVANSVGGLRLILKNDGYLFNTDEEAVLEIKRILIDSDYYNKRVKGTLESPYYSLSVKEYCDKIKHIYFEQ